MKIACIWSNVYQAWLHNLNLWRRSEESSQTCSRTNFFFLFFFSKKVGSGVEAEFHRKDLEFSMELGAVCMKVVAVGVTYPRPDHCKRQRREIGRLEP